MNDNKTALRLYQRVIDENTYLVTEALPRIVAIHSNDGSIDKLEKNLESMLRKNPGMSTDIAYTAIANDIGGIGVIDRCVEHYMLNEPTLAEFIDLQSVTGVELQTLPQAEGSPACLEDLSHFGRGAGTEVGNSLDQDGRAALDLTHRRASVARYVVAVVALLAKQRLLDAVTAELDTALGAAPVAVDQVAVIALLAKIDAAVAAAGRRLANLRGSRNGGSNCDEQRKRCE